MKHKSLIRTFILTILVASSLCLAAPAFADEVCQHEWTEWETVLNPTCADDGEMTRYCPICLDSEYKVIPKTNAHYWDEWMVTKKATVFKKGTKSRECLNCGLTQTKATAKLKPFAKFKKKTYKVKKGKTLKMKSKVKMRRGDSIKKFKSSNKKIATITKSGRLKAKKTGTVKITVVLKSGKKAKCTVRVTAPKKKKSSGSGGGTVYWTPYGSVYHSTKDCPTLSRSRVIKSGSLSSCPKGRACKVCY